MGKSKNSKLSRIVNLKELFPTVAALLFSRIALRCNTCFLVSVFNEKNAVAQRGIIQRSNDEIFCRLHKNNYLYTIKIKRI